MMTDRIPFDELRLKTAVVVNVIQSKLPLIRKDARLAQVTRLCSLMTDCWKFEPKNRPRVIQCCNTVSWIVSFAPIL